MASIERTAYPNLKQDYNKGELQHFFTPTEEELLFIRKKARKSETALHLLVQLKIFQHLRYFVNIEDVPAHIVKRLCVSLGLSKNIIPSAILNTPQRHRQDILRYLNFKRYDKNSRRVLIEMILNFVQMMDNPADIINAILEKLIDEQYELPAFSILDRLVRRIRTLVNERIFKKIYDRLSQEQIKILDSLITLEENSYLTLFNSLKELPKRATLKHLQDLVRHLEWLLGLGNYKKILEGVLPAKIKHFATEANALDAAEIKKFATPKRYVLLVCLIHRAGVKARDFLAEMFIKRIGKIHQNGKEEHEKIKLRQVEKTEKLISVFSSVLQQINFEKTNEELGQNIKLFFTDLNVDDLKKECELITAYFGDNYYPLLWKYFRSHRHVLFRLINILQFHSTTNDQSLIQAINFMLENEDKRGIYLMRATDLSFASEKWRRTVQKVVNNFSLFDRNFYEVCVFSYLAQELKSGDITISDSESYADYREQLLTWGECEPLVENYSSEIGLPNNAQEFVEQLRQNLRETANRLDKSYPKNSALSIGSKGELVITKVKRREPSQSAHNLEREISKRMPERNLLDVLFNVQYYTKLMRHFGPLSGSDPKLENPVERYLLTSFTFGCNLGPSQAARHMRGVVTSRMLSFVNKRHINVQRLNAALVDLLNEYNKFSLPKFWGDGTHASADGTKHELSEQNLTSEYHIRYGGYGGIAYHHVSDLYVALFSHFISCGTWEAVYIIDGLLKNESDIQPEVLHADTQGQTTTVFGLSHMLGIQLMPRIRNIKDLIFYRPDNDKRYKHIGALFGDQIDWELIETHWKDLMQVVLSIKAGKILPSTLLKKLGNYSRNNRLYLAFRELGRVTRTIFLLNYIADEKLREEIHANTNKVESFNGFAKWLLFGGEILQENNPEEQEKLIKYNNLVANALIFQNVVDLTKIINDLLSEGFEIKPEDFTFLSPYQTAHIKRFGDYIIDFSTIPPPLSLEFTFSL